MGKNKIIIKRSSDKLNASFSSKDIPNLTYLDKRYLSDFLTYIIKSMYYRASYKDTFSKQPTNEVEFDFYGSYCYVYLGYLKTSYLFNNTDSGHGFEYFFKNLKSVIPNYEDYLQ